MQTRPRELPPVHDARWTALVTARTAHRSKTLAMNIVLRNVTLSVKRDGSPENLRKNVAELHTFFERNRQVLDGDIAALFG